MGEMREVPRMGRGREMRHYSDGGRATVAQRRRNAPRPWLPPRQDIRFCTSADGTRIAYATSGRARRSSRPPTGCRTSSSTGESPVWMHWLRELSRDHTLVRYDERGCGLSDWDARAVVRGVGDRSRRRRRRAAGVERFPLLGTLAGRVDRDRLRGAPSRARHAPRAAWAATRAAARARGMTRSSQLEEADDDAQAGRARLGPGEPGVPPVLHVAVHSRAASLEQHQWFNELERISTSPAQRGALHARVRRRST